MEIRPDYYDEFQCIGPLCESNCCTAGWQIKVDQNTYNQYQKLKIRGVNLAESVIPLENPTVEEYARIKQNREGNCPLLSDCASCTIHSEFGVEKLSYTCFIYPRGHQKIDNVVERFLTVSCPEAARLILLNPLKMEFNQIDGHEELWDQEMGELTYPLIWPVRVFLISVMQNRKYTISERFKIIGMFLRKISSLAEQGRLNQTEYVIQIFEKNLDSFVFKVGIDSQKQSQLFLKVASSILRERINYPILKEYEALIKRLFNGDDFLDSLHLYRKWETKNSFIMENYFVNYIFAQLVPFKEEDFMKAFDKMCVHYSLLKLQISSLLLQNKTSDCNEAQLIELFYNYERNMEHSTEYVEKILELEVDRFEDKFDIWMLIL